MPVGPEMPSAAALSDIADDFGLSITPEDLLGFQPIWNQVEQFA